MHTKPSVLAVVLTITLVCFAVLTATGQQAMSPENNEYYAAMETVANLTEQGRLNQALTALQQAEPPAELAFEHWYNIGVLQYDLAKFAESTETFQRAVELNDDHENARFNLAASLLQDGRYEESLVQLDRLLEQTDGYSIRLKRGNAFYALGEYSRALIEYGAAVKLHPTNADAYYNLANIQYDNEDFLLAEQNYSQALQIDDGFTEARFNRANTRMHMELYEKALEDYRHILNHAPDDEDAAFNARLAEQMLNAPIEQQGENE